MIPSSGPPSSDRVTALKDLLDWEQSGHPPMDRDAWDQTPALARELILTCIRHQGSLDAWIDHLSTSPPRQPVRAALWIGIAQILLLDGIAEHAAVHETVEAAKQLPIPRGAIGFLNALLRRTVREQETLRSWLDRQPLAVRCSHPPFLVDRWTKSFGKTPTREICEWNQLRSYTFARFTRTAQQPLPPLPNGEPWIEHPQFPGFVQVPRGMSVTDLPGFDQGDWYIQDPSTSIAPALLAPTPDEQVLDACAAPGGKTAILAELMQGGSGHLIACDPNPIRLKRLEENLQRLGHPQVQILQAEPSELEQKVPTLFDAVLLDVPCSNTGVLQRRPDAKWKIRRKEITRLTGLQYTILEDASKRVNPGGRIVYSTCSIEPEETSLLVQRWCGEHSDWTLESSNLLRPGERSSDGCFVSLLRKSAEKL